MSKFKFEGNVVVEVIITSLLTTFLQFRESLSRTLGTAIPPRIPLKDVTRSSLALIGPITFTVCVQVSIFPATSLAVHVTVVIPIGKLDGASLVTVTEQLSLVVGVPKATPVAIHEPASAKTVTLVGHVIVGF
ncbi:hypothetical protein FLACOL7796_00001 [Flavobacterium collinsii]|uniref:Uncharacterized protein n=1 Tax=Flavobacterium collinsii TaxID=1114861 RepID=A0ABN7EFI4_9FLAO|nr:hypothetical protein FLACOL7796_00001 [Flavobacterium collinsii]